MKKIFLIFFLSFSSFVLSNFTVLAHAANTYDYLINGAYDRIPYDLIPYNWIDATGGSKVGKGRKFRSKGFAEISIGFNFNFYGTLYNKVKVSSRGYITFGGVPADDWNSDPIPSPNAPDNLIAPFWDDLNSSDGGGVYYLLEGEAGSRSLTIQWNDVPRFIYDDENDILTNTYGGVTFEVTLYEGSNDVVFQYQDVYFDEDNQICRNENNEIIGFNKGCTATVGIENADGTSGIEYSFYEPVIENQMAIIFYADAQDTSSNWIDATGGTDTGIIDDDVATEISIGFDFTFYENTFNAVKVSSNGYLTFGAVGDNLGYDNYSIPNTSNPNNLIAPFWTDLYPPAGGAVYYLLEGTAPNRRLTIEWRDIPHAIWNDPDLYGTDGGVTFEVTLYEGSNNIVFRYKDVYFEDADLYDNGGTATVGIENAGGTSGIEISHYGTVLENDMAIKFFLVAADPDPDPGSGKKVKADFDGDGKSDILWRNSSDGGVDIWLMDGTAKTSNGSPGPVSDLDWQIKGKGDFDGDGKADILWKNMSTGTVSVWLMNGLEMLASGSPGAESDPAWEIKGVGDFDGDGKSDILWINISTGSVSVWLMDGLEMLANGSGSPGTRGDPFWEIKGVGDFDGDGKSDIIWKNMSTGSVSVWLMDGLRMLADGSPGIENTVWKIKGTGDFDGDGMSDILWRNSGSGRTSIWFMNGLTKISTGSPGRVNNLWQIKDTGDYNGDGKSDILWRKSVSGESGEVKVWLMDGHSKLSKGSPGTVSDLSWEIY